ncbi:MAG: V-type ATP synthase subunit D [Candidatus Omnitrophica bacterium]|nr:V-type ATP synthase subunit D [Candidatus Omnitrophota bacterium]
MKRSPNSTGNKAMAHYKISPTKTNLFKMRRECEFAKEGHQLLEQKRDILLAELMATVTQAAECQKAVDEALHKAHGLLRRSMVRMGRRRVEAAALAVNDLNVITVRERMVMGVRIPVVNVARSQFSPYYSFYNTSVWLDEALAQFQSVLVMLGRLAELKITVVRLSKELKETVRRVNVLEKVHIPDYEDTIKYITDALDEQARGSFFALKFIKSHLARH